MKSLVVMFVAGVAVGTAAAWILATRERPAGTAAAPRDDREPRRQATPSNNIRHAGERSVPPPPRGRPLYDLLPARTGGGVPSESSRDERWAVAMESVVGDHAKGKLLEFIPGASWDGVSCMTRTCTMYFRVPADDAQLAEVVTNFVAGTRFRYRTQDAEEGQVEFAVTAEYRDQATDERLSPEAFMALLARRPPAVVEWEARTKANIDKLKAELRSQR